MRPYSPGGPLNGFPLAQKGSIPPTPGGHRLRPGLPGYLIPFAPLAFAPQRQVYSPGHCLRLRCSSGSLRISPLHPEFRVPLWSSSPAVFRTLGQLSHPLSHKTRHTACMPFTPSNSGQRSPPTYYRGCWHVVSRGFFLWYRPLSSHRKAVYTPKSVFLHAALLGQACAHCRKFLTAASRRSLGRSQSQCG